MLQNAVAHIPELRQVKTSAELQTTITGINLTFDQYYTLLSSAAAQYDNANSHLGKQNLAVY